MNYDIFREELATKYSTYGHALWQPSPGRHYTTVEIGDVGFIREGRFHRLFNILLSGDDPSHQGRVPQHHEPLVLRTISPIDTSTLWPNDLRSNGVLDRTEERRRGAREPDEATQVSFSCSRRRGAILSLPMPAQRNDTTARGDFARCIIKHIDEWFAFARECGLGISREDIILVTGCHLTRTWATIAFQEGGEQVSFGVQVSGVSDVMWQFTREGAQGVAYNLGPSGQNLPENQCIFIRGFRVTRFSMILPRLRAASGPAHLPDEDDPNPDAQLKSIPNESRYQDPLRTLLEYIATTAPDCDMVLVHDDDIQYVDTASLESLRPDIMMSYLRRSAPKIWQLSCDISPTSHGDKSKSKSERPSRAQSMPSTPVLGPKKVRFKEKDEGLEPVRLSRRTGKPASILKSTSDAKTETGPEQITVAALSKFDMADESGPVIARNMIQEGVTSSHRARDLVSSEVRSVVTESDFTLIEDEVASAWEMKVGLNNNKSGIQKWLHAQEFHESISDRAVDRFQFQPQAGTSPEPEYIYRTARSLYRCWLSCKDAFPPSVTQDKWVVDAWNEACSRTDANPNSLVRQDEEIKCDSMNLLTDIKIKIEHAVDSSYEFDTSRALDSIARNAARAQALLAKTIFIYRDFNFGERPRHPYRHPIIQNVINVTWFNDMDDDGIVFHEYFTPISFEVIALALTMIECCIDEWSTGTFKESGWKEVHYKANYLSHLNSLRDLYTHGPHQKGRDLLRRIQDDLLRAARQHAGAPPSPTTGSGKLAIDALDAAVQDDPPEYDSNQLSVPEISFSCE